jgi:hypothetical protein
MKSPKQLSKKILIILFCALFSFCLVQGALAQGTVMTAQASTSQPQVGSTLTVTIKISNVQNLAGIDTIFQWNPSILTLQNSMLNLGDSHSNGVLHGTSIKTDINNANPGDIFVIEEKVSGSYHLVAQSIGASNPSFIGSGTIVTLTFKVLSTGSATFSLETELADHPVSGATANNIDHQDTADTVTAVAAGSSGTPTTPEFPITTIIALTIALVTATAILSIKKIKKTTANSIKNGRR